MRTWRVRDVMSTEVATVRPDTPYREIVDLLASRRVAAVPVVDADRRVVGVVSEGDLLHKVELIGEPHEWRIFEGTRRRAARVKADGMVAADLMATPPVTILGNASVVSAARRMSHERVKRLPVIDDLGRLVGIVTRGDLLRVHLRPDDDIRRDVVDEVLRRVLAVEDGTVQVSVSDGVVRLVGGLDRWSAAQLAGRLAAQVSGVVRVDNELTWEFDDSPLATITAGRTTLMGIA
ncbi:CBS domain-containing protein [Plantactinospora sp. GCM10030261]|uniref:CBS domain-containing protein n=1 Tax=Plantactinospora sp. GCM10030261 TaxID=3273420 RepID=UPI0036149415